VIEPLLFCPRLKFMPLPRFKVDPRPASSARSTHDVASVTRQQVGVAMLEAFQFDGRLSLEVLKNEKSASAVIEDEARRMAANFAKRSCCGGLGLFRPQSPCAVLSRESRLRARTTLDRTRSTVCPPPAARF
jgi:hypothetical protein